MIRIGLLKRRRSGYDLHIAGEVCLEGGGET
jgi:hypothetical protein